jgi:hypothetical protein
MDAFFKENFRFITTLSSSQKVIGGVDVEADEYIVSADLVYNSTLTIDPDGAEVTAAYVARCVADGGTVEGTACFELAVEELSGPSYTYNAQVNSAGTRIIAELEFDDDDLFTFSTEIREFQNICDEFDDSLNCVVFLDKLIDGQPAYVGEEFIGQSGTIYGIATNTSYDFFVPIVLDLSTGEFYFDNSCGGHDGSIGAPNSLINDFTAAYDVEDNVWNTLYSYRPEAIASVDDALYTFKDGTMYTHSDAYNRSTYYGTAYDSVVEVISSQNNSMVKCYEAVSLEGDDAWAGELSNTDQSTSISNTPVTVDSVFYPYGDYEKKERYYYAAIPRDTSANTGGATITALSGTSEVFSLGEIATGGVGGNTVVFSAPIGDIGFPIGSLLYKVSGGNLVSLSRLVTEVIDNNAIRVSASLTGLVNDGDIIVAIANAAIEGDQMRDYYLKLRLTNSNTNEIELYAVNAVFSPSKLHNELGQQ